MGYNGVGPAAGGAVAGGTLAATGVDVLLWTLGGIVFLLCGLVLVRLGMLNRDEDS